MYRVVFQVTAVDNDKVIHCVWYRHLELLAMGFVRWGADWEVGGGFFDLSPNMISPG